LYHSTLGSRVIKKKKKGLNPAGVLAEVVSDEVFELQLPQEADPLFAFCVFMTQTKVVVQ